MSSNLNFIITNIININFFKKLRSIIILKLQDKCISINDI